uniref:ORF1 n=1 Tax=Macaque picobirnavirus 6 TaxID=2078822 RepID=A0A2L1FE61_9VIRU|nr:ORF1 [Macaque picobirnavirus 6]
MTGNQIQYQRNVETERHNRVTEEEQKRSNLANERETYRHNYATEVLGTNTLSETKRHNLATESNQLNSLLETTRHNKVMEQNDAVKATASLVSSNASLMNAQANTLKTYSDLKYADVYAGATYKKASADYMKANTDRKRYDLEQEMQPYKKWESGTKSFSNVVSSLANRSKANTEKKNSRSVRTKNYLQGFGSWLNTATGIAGFLFK